MKIEQKTLSDEIKKEIFRGLSRQSIEATGVDGFSEDPVSF